MLRIIAMPPGQPHLAVLFATLVLSLTSLVGCARKVPAYGLPISEEGLNVVRVESDPHPGAINTHPASLAPNEVAAILRGVRVWEQRNIIHRLFSGPAPRTRAFRDEEIAFLAPAIAKALTQAGHGERVYFHVSHPTPSGEEETSSGWIFVREPLLHLVLTEVHDRHGPGPDISKYDRQMPDVPEVPGTFNATFEPETYLAKVVSKSSWFSPDQQEELRIVYRGVLSDRLDPSESPPPGSSREPPRMR